MDNYVRFDIVEYLVDGLGVQNIELYNVWWVDAVQACTNGFPSCSCELALYLPTEESAGFATRSVEHTEVCLFVLA